MVKNDPLAPNISSLRRKLKNRLDEVNCIAISYKSRPWAPLSKQYLLVSGGAGVFSPLTSTKSASFVFLCSVLKARLLCPHSP